MKKTITFLLTILVIAYSNAQAPSIQWQKTFGGLNIDVAQSIQPTSDGGYILAGSSNSTNGDVTGNHGGLDYWLVKLDAVGAIQWQKSLGGSNNDEAYTIKTTSDGGYVVAGYSQSNDGNVTGNLGFLDYWVVKLDATGTIQWQKSLGGSGLDRASSIQTTADGGFVVAGYSQSINGDVTGNHGAIDYWVVKLNATGIIQWQKSLGGSGDEYANSIQTTSDGGYIIAGQTSSTDGNVTVSYGNYDYWVVKLDATGLIQWQKSLGGSGGDIAYDVQPTTDGGYVIAGASSSVDGDVTGNHGISDYWVVKLDANGTMQWQKTIGGSGDDGAYVIQTTQDGGYVVAGYGASTDGDQTGNQGAGDYWVVKLNATGTIQWQKSLGGSVDDYIRAIHTTLDGGYFLSGYTQSSDGNVTGNQGGKDYWVVKLSAATLATADFEKQTIVIYPNPVDDILQFQIPINTSITKIKILDVSGKVILEQNQNNNTINIGNLAKGTYILEANSSEYKYFSKFMKE